MNCFSCWELSFTPLFSSLLGPPEMLRQALPRFPWPKPLSPGWHWGRWGRGWRKEEGEEEGKERSSQGSGILRYPFLAVPRGAGFSISCLHQSCLVSPDAKRSL